MSENGNTPAVPDPVETWERQPGESVKAYAAFCVYRRVVKPAARSAGVPWAAFHTLRHTRATMLFKKGCNTKQVQVWLGHHSPAFTLAAYVHLLPDDLPDADVLEVLRPDGVQAEPQRVGARVNSCAR